MQPENARRRALDLTERLESRTKELETQRDIISMTPIVAGGVLIIPQGLLNQLSGNISFESTKNTDARKQVELLAMQAVMQAEKNMGFEPEDVSKENYGWDILSRTCKNGDVRFIEVKGRAKGESVYHCYQK